MPRCIANESTVMSMRAFLIYLSETVNHSHIEPHFEYLRNPKQDPQKYLCEVKNPRLLYICHREEWTLKFLEQWLNHLRYGIACANHGNHQQRAHKLCVWTRSGPIPATSSCVIYRRKFHLEEGAGEAEEKGKDGRNERADSNIGF